MNIELKKSFKNPRRNCLMKSRTIARFFILSGILVFLITGCVTIVAKTEAVPSTPTVIIVPTATQSGALQPTVAPLQVALKEYTHKSNIFSLSYPADWVLTEDIGAASMLAPDKSGEIVITAINTSSALDNTQFTDFVNAYEANAFAAMKNYKETKRDIQSDKNYAQVTKTLDISQIPYQISTLYERKGAAIYIETYLTASSAVAKIGPLFTQVDNTFKSNPDYVADLNPYSTSLFAYPYLTNLFSIGIPYTWNFVHNENTTTGIIADVSTSPDGNAIVVIQDKDLGKKVTQPITDAEALKNLKVLSPTARIAHIDPLKDGTIQWSWAPQDGSAQAVSFYKGNGTNFYMITFLFNKGFDVYKATMNDMMNTYTVPQ